MHSRIRIQLKVQIWMPIYVVEDKQTLGILLKQENWKIDAEKDWDQNFVSSFFNSGVLVQGVSDGWNWNTLKVIG